MGKSKIYVNGKLLAEHFGGYLPVVVDVTDALEFGKENLIAVWADNSNDPNYPPGKQQEVLDFTYFGGIYRDCWLIAHNQVFITDPNYENEEAGGGLFVAYNNVSDHSAEVLLKIQIRNSGRKSFQRCSRIRTSATGRTTSGFSKLCHPDQARKINLFIR